jgi:hypothetical protein
MNTALLACTVGDAAWLKRCMSSRFDPSTTDKEGLTCLHLAAKNGHIDCLRYLLDSCRCDVDEAETTSGRTALHFSVSNRRSPQTSLQVAKLLLERGADPNRQSEEGWTSLHVAASNGHARCLKRLLEHGADIHLSDSQGRTACDIATLHGHFECARLLRSLHWARRKDRQLTSELQKKTEEKRRQHERALIESRLKKEAADRAYQLWGQNKSKMTVEPPTACRERQELGSPGSCSSCNTSRTSSGRQSASRAKLTAPISVTMDQAKRNIECTGRPAKLHPYSNYPPRKQCRPSSKKASVRSGRSSRASNTTSSPSPAPLIIASDRRIQEQDGNEMATAQPQRVDENTTLCRNQENSSDSGEEQCDVTDHRPSELNLGLLKNSSEPLIPETESDETADDVEVQFLIGGVDEDDEGETEAGIEYEEGDDEIAFHDVGRANSLSLPGALTKNRSVACVMKLLRHLGSSGSGSHASRYTRRRSFSCGLQRRFSLGAIPEGQMVTNYSNESVVSLEEKSSWLRLPDTRRSGIWQEGDEGGRGEAKDDNIDRRQVLGESSASDYSSQTEVEREGDNDDRAQVERKTLKIVNLLWDVSSSTVQTSVTESPMTPLNHTLQSATPRPRPTSPHTPPSPISSSHHSSPISSSHHSSPTPVHTPPNSKSSGTSVSRPVLLRLNSSHFPASYFSSELEDLQEAESSLDIIASPRGDSDTSHAPQTLDQPSLPAHSLFGSLMGGIASKSMVSLEAANSCSAHHESGQSVSLQLRQRRAKSAPNILDFQKNEEKNLSNHENTLEQ